MSYAVHACYWILVTESREPFDISQRITKVTKLWGKIEDEPDLSNSETCGNVQVSKLSLDYSKQLTYLVGREVCCVGRVLDLQLQMPCRSKQALKVDAHLHCELA